MIEPVFLAALNHLLGGANWARERLKPYAGKRARLEMSPFSFGFEISAEGYVQQSNDPSMPDVTVRLPAATPFLLPQGLDRIMAEAQVEGNAEFATELSFVFRNLHWDAEEDLSRLVGDIAARRLVQGATGFLAWQKQAVTNLGENIAEYLAYENHLLVPSAEFSAWRSDIGRLADDLFRLETRCKSLN